MAGTNQKWIDLKNEVSARLRRPISLTPKLGANIETIFGFSYSVHFWAERNFVFNANAIIFELVGGLLKDEQSDY